MVTRVSTRQLDQGALGSSLPSGVVGNTLYLSAGPDTYTATNAIGVNPTGGVDIRWNGLEAAKTVAAGLAIFGEGAGGLGDTRLEWRNLNGSPQAREAYIGTELGFQFEIISEVNSKPILIAATDASGTVRTILNANPDSTTVIRADTDLLLQGNVGSVGVRVTGGDGQLEAASVRRAKAFASGLVIQGSADDDVELRLGDTSTNAKATFSYDGDPHLNIRNFVGLGNITLNTPGVISGLIGGFEKFRIEEETMYLSVDSSVRIPGSGGDDPFNPTLVFGGPKFGSPSPDAGSPSGIPSLPGIFTDDSISLAFTTRRRERFRIEGDGTLSVFAGSPAYEKLVTGPDDIPNKAYVDSVAGGGGGGSPHPASFGTFLGDVGGPIVSSTPGSAVGFVGGTAITTTLSGSPQLLTITNDAPNVDQLLFSSVLSDSGTAVADSTTDTLSILGGTGISTAVAADAVTITNDAPNVVQTITLTGDVTGSGTGSFATTVGNDSHSHTGSTISGLAAADTTTGTFAAARIPVPTTITVADESSDTTCFPLFATAATGNLAPKSGTNLTFNSSSGLLTATNFSGGGASLTGVNADTLDSVNSTSFLRSDAADQKTSGDLRFNDSVQCNFGTGNDAELYANGSNLLLDLNSSGVTSFLVRDGTTTRFTFGRSTGDFTATGDVTGNSDIRLKENLEQIPFALDKVEMLTGYTYEKKGPSKRRHVGVVAQEVEEVLPEAVLTDEHTGMKSVAYGNMVGLLIEAVKDLSSEIKELKMEVEELKNGSAG